MGGEMWGGDYPTECILCGDEAFILASGKCRRCRLAELNGGYVYPEYFRAENDGPFAEEGRKVCDALGVMLGKYALFGELYGY